MQFRELIYKDINGFAASNVYNKWALKKFKKVATGAKTFKYSFN